jgi:hypothetical protein
MRSRSSTAASFCHDEVTFRIFSLASLTNSILWPATIPLITRKMSGNDCCEWFYYFLSQGLMAAWLGLNMVIDGDYTLLQIKHHFVIHICVIYTTISHLYSLSSHHTNRYLFPPLYSITTLHPIQSAKSIAPKPITLNTLAETAVINQYHPNQATKLNIPYLTTTPPLVLVLLFWPEDPSPEPEEPVPTPAGTPLWVSVAAL